MDTHSGPYIDLREYGDDHWNGDAWCHNAPCHEYYCAHRDTCPVDNATHSAATLAHDCAVLDAHAGGDGNPCRATKP